MKFPNLKNTLMTAAGVGGGILIGQMAAKKIPVGSDKVRAGLIILIGGFLAGKGKKGMMQNIGIGMIGSGGYSLIKSFVPSIGDLTDNYGLLGEFAGLAPALNGTDTTNFSSYGYKSQSPALNGVDIAGMDDDLTT